MITIKLKFEQEIDILKEQKTFNNIVRLSFNRYQEGYKEKDIRKYLKDKFPNINSWFVQCAIRSAAQLYTRHGDKKIIFGGKYNLKQYLKKLITKDEFRQKRLLPINIQGEQNYKGNRLFDFDFENHRVIFKPSRKDHRIWNYKVPHKKIKNDLLKLQELRNSRQIAITVSFTKSHICLTFDETKIINCNFKDLKKNRLLGIDMNPNYIGLSILEFDDNDNFKVLNKQVFDLSKLTKTSYESSDHPKSKYLNNKRRHEIIQIAHDITKLVDYWKCNKIVIEKLNIKSTDHGIGKTFNRLCNNIWNRNLLTNKLKSLSLLYNFGLIEINAAYSSFIGNIIFGNENTPDMIAASIEIARRGYKKFEKNWFYPSIKDERIDEQWKQTLSGFDDWKSAFQEIKKSKVKYRFLLTDYIQNAVFSIFYKNKHTSIYQFV